MKPVPVFQDIPSLGCQLDTANRLFLKRKKTGVGE
jgi:hypothetical protein